MRCRAAAPAAATDDAAAEDGDAAAEDGDAAADDTGAAAETRRLRMIATPIASPTVWFLHPALTYFLVAVCHVIGNLLPCVLFVVICSAWYLIRWFWLIGGHTLPCSRSVTA